MKAMVRRLPAIAGTAVIAVAAVLSATAPAIASGQAVPFVDPSAHGYIALCDLAGNNVTSGSINTAPFVWKAVSSLPAPDGYSGRGQNTGLLIYQVRRDVDPGNWNGDILTAATNYKLRRYPAAEATYKDFSLADFIREFPSNWDGLYQLRMHFAKHNYGVYAATYPATVIQVVGQTWHVVQGGTLPCTSAVARSTELQVGIPQLDPKQSSGETPPTAAPSTRAVPSSGATSTPSSGVTGGGATSNSSSPGDRLISAPVSGSVRTTASTSNVTVIVLGALCGVLAVLLVGGSLWRRRRSGTSA